MPLGSVNYKDQSVITSLGIHDEINRNLFNPIDELQIQYYLTDLSTHTTVQRTNQPHHELTGHSMVEAPESCHKIYKTEARHNSNHQLHKPLEPGRSIH